MPEFVDPSVMPDFGPIVAPLGEVFVTGDSRNFGTLPTNGLVGRAFVII